MEVYEYSSVKLLSGVWEAVNLLVFKAKVLQKKHCQGLGIKAKDKSAQG